jgi:hypothetical protein
LARVFDPAARANLNCQVFERQYNVATTDQREETRAKKLQTTIARLAPLVERGEGKLLDVGAGEGWGRLVAEYFGMSYHIVEAQPELAKRLERAGATFTASTIPNLQSRWAGQFEVMILRRVLEHLPVPIGDLEILGQCLSTEGVISVAVPNFERSKSRGNFVTDFLRLEHISYFNPSKLQWCLNQARLAADSVHAADEIWALARLGSSEVELDDEREVNGARFDSLMRADRRREILNIVRVVALRSLSGLPGPIPRMARWAWWAVPSGSLDTSIVECTIDRNRDRRSDASRSKPPRLRRITKGEGYTES